MNPFVALETQIECLNTWVSRRTEMATTFGAQSSAVTDSDLFTKRMCGALIHAVPYYVAADIQDVLMRAAIGVPDDETLPDDLVPEEPLWIFLESSIPGRLLRPDPRSQLDPDGSKPVNIHQLLIYKGMSDDPDPLPVVIIGAAGTSHDQPSIYRATPYLFAPVEPSVSTVDDWRSRVAGDTTGFKDLLPFLIAFFRFIRQRIVLPSLYVPVRHEQRRIQKQRLVPSDPVVRVVQLRTTSSAARGGTADRQYSCRWIVRGHWHSYWCGVSGATRELRWLLPHIAGPPGRPLKASTTTLYAVVR